MIGKAFTLIELLVVIAIIGLLSTIAVVAMSGARIKAREAKWVADKNQIIKALNLYYSDNGAWPLSGDWICFGGPSSETCWGGSHTGYDGLVTAMSPYMSSFPITGADAGTLAYNRFVYHSANSLAGQVGAFLVWPKENTMVASECNSAYPPQHEDKYWYCYEYLGP